MKLALKFTFAFLLGMSAVIAAQAVYTCRREIAFYEADTRRDQHVLAKALASAVRRVWLSSGRSEALEFVEEANRAEAPNRVSMRWLALDSPGDADQEPILPTSLMTQLRQGSEVQWIDRSKDSPGRLYTFVPLVVQGSESGAVRVGESLADQQPQIQAIITRVLQAAAEVTVLCSLLALYLGVRLVGRPVSALIRRTRAISSGDLDSTLELRQRDELQVLADAVNRMSSQLAEARRRVESENAARIATIEQLRHADRLKTVGQLASGVAHELGTPLNVIAARAKKLVDDPRPDVRDSARTIHDQAMRMTRIIRQLLDFARPRAPRHRRVDLKTIVTQSIALLESMARRQQVSIIMKTQDDLNTDADADQMLQVISNLIVNGIQAMPHGGELSILLGRQSVQPPADHGGPRDDYLFIQVQDEGPGIDAAALPRIFEPFFTTKDIGVGTGLGLSVSQGIVREHGGWIAASNEPGRGACFTVYLPCQQRTTPSLTTSPVEIDQRAISSASPLVASPVRTPSEGVKTC